MSTELGHALNVIQQERNNKGVAEQGSALRNTGREGVKFSSLPRLIASGGSNQSINYPFKHSATWHKRRPQPPRERVLEGEEARVVFCVCWFFRFCKPVKATPSLEALICKFCFVSVLCFETFLFGPRACLFCSFVY